MSVQAFLEYWLTAKRSTVTDGTLRFYIQHAEYAIPHIGKLPLEALEPRHVRAMLAALRKGGLSTRSCDHVLSVLGNALGMAVRERAVRENIIKLVERPRVEQFEPYVLQPAEIDRLLAAAAHYRLGAFLELTLALGTRNAELRQVRWADYQRDAQTLTIRDAKTAAGRRILPLTDHLCHILDTVWHERQEERQLPHWQEHGLIFCSEVGTPLAHRNLLRWFKAVLRRAGLPEQIRLHDLRHTAITEWIAAGSDVKAAQELAGHARPETTMRIYARARDDAKRAAIVAAEERRKVRREDDTTREQYG